MRSKRLIGVKWLRQLDQFFLKRLCFSDKSLVTPIIVVGLVAMYKDPVTSFFRIIFALRTARNLKMGQTRFDK